MTDQEFPYIRYEAGRSPREWGRMHGETYRAGIGELAALRRQLMQARSPHLHGPYLETLAARQWERTRRCDHALWAELDGIREGAALGVTDLVILNNYTDFRDIPAREGCTTAYVRTDGTVLAGQTWDMHCSAKDYVCVLHAPAADGAPETIAFSLVGCAGMMGFNAAGCLVGVNNLATADARAGVLWPALVRSVLKRRALAAMQDRLLDTPVTSAHGYLLGSRAGARVWEITPTRQIDVTARSGQGPARLYHTNHCLAPETAALELPGYLSPTTRERYARVGAKIDAVRDLESLYALLSDHEGYPRSICLHFEDGAPDPPFTCGGAIGDLGTGQLYLWRGCETYDENHRVLSLTLQGERAA